jgi:hypothetical protein
MTVQISQRGKEYLETARTLLRAAKTMTDQAIAGQLKALADDYERRAEKASYVDAAKASAGLNAILPDGRAAARGVDEAASRRAPGGVALRDRQTGWQGSLGWKAAVLGSSRPFRSARSRRGGRSGSNRHGRLPCDQVCIVLLGASNVALGAISGTCGAAISTPEESRARTQFPSKEITRDQDYCGCARYPEIIIGARSPTPSS